MGGLYVPTQCRHKFSYLFYEFLVRISFISDFSLLVSFFGCVFAIDQTDKHQFYSGC